MKCALLLSASVFIFFSSKEQAPNPNAISLGSLSGPVSAIQRVEGLDRDWKMHVVSSGGTWELGENFSGTVFFNDEWDKGYIRLDNNQVARDLSLKFNTYKNEIYMRRDTQVLVVDVSAVPVAEFGLFDSSGLKVFRRGFPAVGNNTAATFYEVLVAGKIALLRLHAKRIVEKRDLNHVPVQEMTNAEFWYIFDSTTNTTIPIKHNKNALLEALPGQADAIRKIIETDKLKLRNDDDWVMLFNQLNNKL